MLDCERVRALLRQLDWSRGLNREGVLGILLDQNIALPNEFLSAIPAIEVFHSPDELLKKVPDIVWVIHGERERRARGLLENAQDTKRTRQRQAG